jgi:hypothetical protein
MSIEEKRANMIKAICNSDAKGIELMYNKLFSSNAISGITSDKFDEACIRIMRRCSDSDFAVGIIAASFFAELSCELFKKKEDK